MRRRREGGWHFGPDTPRDAVGLGAAFGGASGALALCAALAKIEREWEYVVGRALCARSAPKGFSKGVLRVAAESGGAMADMNFKKRGILERLNNLCPSLVRDLEIFSSPAASRREVRRYTGYGRKPRRETKPDPDRAEEIRASLAESAEGRDLPAELAGDIARLRALCEKKSPIKRKN